MVEFTSSRNMISCYQVLHFPSENGNLEEWYSIGTYLVPCLCVFENLKKKNFSFSTEM